MSRTRRRRPRQDCLICYAPTRQKPLACQHTYHQECLQAWQPGMHPGTSCPICVPQPQTPANADANIPTTTRYCPGCGIGIEKDGGCNLMMCTVCGDEFDWSAAPRTQPEHPRFSYQEIMEYQFANAVQVDRDRQNQQMEYCLVVFFMLVFVAFIAYCVYWQQFTRNGQIYYLKQSVAQEIAKATQMQADIARALQNLRDYEAQITALLRGATTHNTNVSSYLGKPLGLVQHQNGIYLGLS